MSLNYIYFKALSTRKCKKEDINYPGKTSHFNQHDSKIQMRWSRKIDILNVHYLEMLAEKNKTARGGNRKVCKAVPLKISSLWERNHTLYTQGKNPTAPSEFSTSHWYPAHMGLCTRWSSPSPTKWWTSQQHCSEASHSTSYTWQALHRSPWFMDGSYPVIYISNPLFWKMSDWLYVNDAHKLSYIH